MDSQTEIIDINKNLSKRNNKHSINEEKNYEYKEKSE